MQRRWTAALARNPFPARWITSRRWWTPTRARWLCGWWSTSRATCSKSKCMCACACRPARRAADCWSRCRRFCAMMKICPSVFSSRQMAVWRGDTSPWAAARAINTTSPKACRRPTRSWWTEPCFFSSCRINERRAPSCLFRTAYGVDDESHRGFLAAPAVSGRLDGAAAHRRRVFLAAAPARGCLSGPGSAHGRGHHAVARPRRRRNRAPDHGARRTRDERHSALEHHPLHLAVRPVRRDPHFSGRHRQLLRAPAGLQSLPGTHIAGQRVPDTVAHVRALRADLPLRPAEPGPLADGTQDLRGLGGRTAVQVRARCGG